jgi:hypothetical protein
MLILFALANTAVVADPPPTPTPTAIMPFGLDGNACFRIPSVLSVSVPPQSKVQSKGVEEGGVVVMVIAETREETCADAGEHALAYIRSPDGGVSWSPVRYIYNDTDPSR